MAIYLINRSEILKVDRFKKASSELEVAEGRVFKSIREVILKSTEQSNA